MKLVQLLCFDSCSSYSGDAECASYGSCSECPNCKPSLVTPFHSMSLKKHMVFAQVYNSFNVTSLVQARPTMYQVVKDMIDKMGYTVSFSYTLSFSSISINAFSY